MNEPYVRADTNWLAACRYGIGVHWTAMSAPRSGPARPFAEAVARFDLPEFLAGVKHAGAEYVLFTLRHAQQKLPAPHPVLDALAPGRTTERDLIGELADGLAALGVPLLCYYNHSCNQADDPAWEQAVGYHAPDKSRFFDNLCRIVGWMGDRYGQRIQAWWFDSSYSVDNRGPHNSVSTDLGGWRFPWEQYTRAAKQGHAGRLVAYNAGVMETYLYTAHQDYWAGEMVNLDAPPAARYLPNGLQWFGWTCLDDQAWVHARLDAPMAPPLYHDEQVLAFLRRCRKRQAPMTFNVAVCQEGCLAEASVEQLHRVGAALRSDGA